MAAINADLEGAEAAEVVEWAVQRFGDALVMSSSFGAQSALTLHLVTKVKPDIPIVFIDTGYLFPETYQFAQELTEQLGLNTHVYAPRMTPARQEALYGRLWQQGDEGLKQYYQLNKVEPMRRALEDLGARAWIAGLRADQNNFRAGLRHVEEQDGRFKVHPVLNFTDADVTAYFEKHDLPYHPLFFYGYRSIGDVHSTEPTDENQDARVGRRLGAKSECGIHLPEEQEASRRSSGL